MSENRSVDELYPLLQNAPDMLRSKTGLALEDLTVGEIDSGRVTGADVTISAETLKLQAEVALRSGRSTNARNLERGSELVDVPQELLLETYEMLRPGRTSHPAALLKRAEMFRVEYGAVQIAELIEEAARTYERRGLFRKRF